MTQDSIRNTRTQMLREKGFRGETLPVLVTNMVKTSSQRLMLHYTKLSITLVYITKEIQPRTQALHCFYRDQRQLIIQARKGARSTRNEGSAWQKMQIFVVTYRLSCF